MQRPESTLSTPERNDIRNLAKEIYAVDIDVGRGFRQGK